VIAASAEPLPARIDAAANCADPANVVADMTSEASTPIPALRATSPNEAPKNQTVAATAAAVRTPSR
jgi:hypothetical protein